MMLCGLLWGSHWVVKDVHSASECCLSKRSGGITFSIGSITQSFTLCSGCSPTGSRSGTSLGRQQQLGRKCSTSYLSDGASQRPRVSPHLYLQHATITHIVAARE